MIGNGNVALDVARILAKTRAEFDGSDIVGHALEALDRSAIRTITMLGRRGPHQIAMTPKELGELGHLEDASPVVDPPTSRRSRPTTRSSPASASRSPSCATSPHIRADEPSPSASSSISSPGRSGSRARARSSG